MLMRWLTMLNCWNAVILYLRVVHRLLLLACGHHCVRHLHLSSIYLDWPTINACRARARVDYLSLHRTRRLRSFLFLQKCLHCATLQVAHMTRLLRMGCLGWCYRTVLTSTMLRRGFHWRILQRLLLWDAQVVLTATWVAQRHRLMVLLELGMHVCTAILA